VAVSFKKALRLTAFTVLGTSIGITAGTFASSKAPPTTKTYQQLLLFADVLAIVQDGYVEPVDDAELVEHALNGMLHSLDPHSRYVAPKKYEKSEKKARREYGGLGIEVSMVDGLVKVNYANTGAPAARAGLKAGDRITHIEGDPVMGKTLNEATDDMRGLAGDAITITVKSVGQPPRDVTIVRETIQGRAIRQRMHEGVGYIYLETFTSENLARDLEEAIGLLEEENGAPLPGLILDIRNNGGGLLMQSIDVAGHFMDGGEVVSVRGRHKTDNERYHAKHGQLLADTPIVVLINGNSASASEIVAGALQDRGRALIVGTQSFGKGSVQSKIPLQGGRRGALRLTTARYFTPSGQSIQGIGITPDIWVEAFPDDGRKRMSIRESSLPNSLDSIIQKTEGKKRAQKQPPHEYPPNDWAKDKDYQLKRAVDILKSADYETRLRDAFNN